jgi:hypothetical protein
VSFFLCWSVLYTAAPVVQTGGEGRVLVYICVSGPYGLSTAHRGPCIANYIPTLLGLEEYTELSPPTLFNLEYNQSCDKLHEQNHVTK